MELPAGARVDRRPAIFTVILETGHVGAEERSKLASAASPLTFITQLVIQDVWLDFHLNPERSAQLHAGPSYEMLKAYASLNTFNKIWPIFITLLILNIMSLQQN